MVVDHAQEWFAAFDKRANDREIGHLMDVNRVGLEIRKSLFDNGRVVTRAERGAKWKGGLPSWLTLASAGSMQNAKIMAAPAKLCGGDMSIRFRSSERPKPFVDEKQFHLITKPFRHSNTKL
jgi:hypothetical protein